MYPSIRLKIDFQLYKSSVSLKVDGSEVLIFKGTLSKLMSRKLNISSLKNTIPYFKHLPIFLSVTLLSVYTIGCNAIKRILPLWAPSQGRSEVPGWLWNLAHIPWISVHFKNFPPLTNPSSSSNWVRSTVLNQIWVDWVNQAMLFCLHKACALNEAHQKWDLVKYRRQVKAKQTTSQPCSCGNSNVLAKQGFIFLKRSCIVRTFLKCSEMWWTTFTF